MSELAHVASEMARVERQQPHHHHHGGPSTTLAAPHHHHHHVVHHSHPHAPVHSPHAQTTPLLSPALPGLGLSPILTLEQLQSSKADLAAQIAAGREAMHRLQMATTAATFLLDTVNMAIDNHNPEEANGKQAQICRSKSPAQLSISPERLPTVTITALEKPKKTPAKTSPERRQNTPNKH